MTRALLSAALLALILPAGAALAQPVPDDVVRAEVIGGWRTADGTHMAALRLTLAEGWKTYWRAPGDAGIAPQFDWRGSTNIGGVAFHWPRPDVFHLNGMRTLGYSDELILPMEFTPRDGGPMAISAEVNLGVCAEVCVPVTLHLNAALPEAAGPDPVIRAALAQVPPGAVPDRIACSVEPLRDGLRLTADIGIAAMGPDETVVVELSDPTIWVSGADVSRDGASLRATVDMVPATAQPFALDRSGVRITILAGGRAVDLKGCPS